MEKNKFLKIYSIVVSVALVLTTTGFLILFFHGNYDMKILVKLGLEEWSDQTAIEVENMNGKLDFDADVVFFGDSITYGSNFEEYFPDKIIANLGCPGDTLIGMIDRVSDVKVVTPEKVFVMGGINSITDENISDCLKTYSELIDSLRNNVSCADIYIQSVLPISSSKELTCCHNSTIQAFNQELEKLAADYGMTYVDLYCLYEYNGEMNPTLTNDGVHIYPEAYEMWAAKIRQYIE